MALPERHAIKDWIWTELKNEKVDIEKDEHPSETKCCGEARRNWAQSCWDKVGRDQKELKVGRGQSAL